MSREERRKELSRQMLQEANGLELVMNRYQEVTGMFPSSNLTPRQIIDVIVQCEINRVHESVHSRL